MSDDELILYILGGVGSDFESVVVNLTSRDFITLEEVQFLLQTHVMRLEQLAIASLTKFSHPEAFMKCGHQAIFRGRSNFLGRGRSSPGGRHYSSFGKNNKPHCQICGKIGHMAMKCFHRFDVGFQHQSQFSPNSHTNLSSIPTNIFIFIFTIRH